MDLPNSPVLTCKDHLLDVDWGHADYAEDVNAVQLKLQDILPEREFEKLEEIAQLMQGTHVGNAYKHTREA